MKYKPYRRNIRTRESLPVVINKQIMCPFCNPPHPIAPDKLANCGTRLKVSAEQMVILAHTVKEKRYKCLKCGEGGGEMVMSGTGFVHLVECKPDLKLLNEPPPVSERARFVFHLPEKVRKLFEKYTGEAKELHEIDERGNDTGKVLGYFFYKG